MNNKEIIDLLYRDIHSVVLATVDQLGKPVTCVIDLMLADEQGIYFLTAKGKSLYDRLIAHPDIAVTGFKGEDTMSSISISLTAHVKEIGSQRVSEIFVKNPYMAEIYPDEKSRAVLTVFQMYTGQGELFDLSQKPIYRESFQIGHGSETTHQKRYFINERCIACSSCIAVCPQKCIKTAAIPFEIVQANCLHCGLCKDICPVGAIEKGN